MKKYMLKSNNIGNKRLFIREPGRDNKQDGTTTKIRRLQLFLHKFVFTFI